MCDTLIVNSGKLIRLKVKRYCSIALFIFLQAVLCTPHQNCPKQTSSVRSNTSQTVSWKSTSIDNEIVISDPSCIDQDGGLITRICLNGSWIPEHPPQCHSIIQNNNNCPTLFKQIDDSCIYISKHQPWSTRCSLINILYSNITQKKNSPRFEDDFIWLPLQRKTNYGPYEWVTMGEKYGEPMGDKFKLSYTYDVFNKNCLVSDIYSKNTLAEYCDNLHTHICSYRDEYDSQICPKDCVSAGIGTATCYCKRRERSVCHDAATINSPFEKSVLLALADKDECYVGGTNSRLAGYRQALNKSLWYYTRKHLNCSLCSVRSIDDFPKAQMLLTFDKNDKKLLLQIYSPEGLSKEGDEDYIYCFTDASKELKKRVKVELKHKYFRRNTRERTFFVYKVKLEKYVGYYWCEAHRKSISDELVYSNRILAYKEKEGNEYSLRMVIDNICLYVTCNYSEAISYNELADNLYDNVFKKLDAEIRVMEVFYFDYFKLDVLIHLSMDDEEDVVKEYYLIKEHLKNVSVNIHVGHFLSSEYCLPEVTKAEDGQLSWPLTYLHNSVVPEELCLQSNHLPMFRVCEGNFLYGGKWSQVTGKCDYTTEIDENLNFLHRAVQQNVSQTLIQNVTDVIEEDTSFSVAAVHYLEKIFERILSTNLIESSIITSTVNMTNSLLKIKPAILAEAQNCLNSTDNILDAIEDILTNIRLESQVFLIQKKNIIVHITNPFLSNISGIIVYSSSDKDLRVENYQRNNSFEHLLGNPAIFLAVHVPERILEDIYNQTLTNISIVTTIFFNNNLFVSNSKKRAGPIVSVTIPGYGNYLPSSLPVIFKTDENQTVPECAFWDYGKNTQRKRGEWSTIGGNYLGKIENKSNVHFCSYSHLTHFALLVLDDNISAQYLNNTDDEILTVITCLGGSLTITGVTGIFATAILFEKWRNKSGTKILLNLSVAFLLEALTVYLAEVKIFVQSDLSCQITGSMIHYTVLSKFLWMLVYAFLQYMRFVKVLGTLPENIVWKSAVFAWGFSIIPVMIVNILTPTTYSYGDHTFCYPKGMSLYLGLLMPVVFIILVNLVVFCIVMYQVSKTRIESHCGNTDSCILQIKLGTLLFFVLGIPWIFGVLANLITIDWFRTMLVYLFCITSTIQGFILFLFYIVFNRETRSYWTSYVLSREVSVVITTSKT